MQFDRGYLSPYFVTDPERMEVALENAYILINEKKISSHEGSSPLLDRSPRAASPWSSSRKTSKVKHWQRS